MYKIFFPKQILTHLFSTQINFTRSLPRSTKLNCIFNPMNSRWFFTCFLALWLWSYTAYSQGITLIDRELTTAKTLQPTPWPTPAKVPDLRQAEHQQQQDLKYAQQQGYLQIEFSHSAFQNDTLYRYWRIGPQTRIAHLQLIDPLLRRYALAETVEIPFTQIQSQLENYSLYLQNQGYPLARVQLADFHLQRDTLIARVQVATGEARRLDRLVLEGYPQFSKNHRRYLQRKYRNAPLTPALYAQLEREVQAWPFVQIARPAQTLFTTDSTHLYIYVEKSKANRFDGIIGFSNDEAQSKVIFSGYLDAELHNLIHRGEQLQIQWKSNGQEQRSFNGKVELPYLFSLPLALQGELSIFQQDSTFQNASTAIGLGYYIGPRWKTYLAYRKLSSSDVLNTNSAILQDFESRFWDWKNTYQIPQTDWPLYGPRLRAQTQLSTGTRTNATHEQSQFQAQANWEALLPINNRHALYLANGLYWLSSDDYLTNELPRIGGAKTLRGFLENQFAANTYAWLQTEYRYIVAANLYVHSVLDLGYYQDHPNQFEGRMWSAGVGAGLLTPMGVLSLVYANGTHDDQPFKFANSLFHFTLRTSF